MDEMANDDIALLRAFARENSETAFAEIVARHVNLVYSVALRQTRDAHLAEEITQAVFIILARKAGSLGDKIILSGWLCRTARYASANALKIQMRRQKREQEAFMQSQIESPENSMTETWNEISPLLDGAMERLGQKDHDALVLRFFENKNFAEVGAALGASESAAKMRVNRALEKLRKIFAKRGVSSTTAILAGTISANSIQAAPVGLAKTISAVTIAKGAAASTSTLTLIKGALKIMAWTKTKTIIVAGLIVLLAVGTTTVTVKEIQKHEVYPWQVPQADFDVFYKTPAQIKIVPTKFSTNGFSVCDSGRGAMGICQSLEEIVQIAYQKNKLRTMVVTDLPTGKYDYFAKLVDGMKADAHWMNALQKAIEQKFGVTGHLEMRNTDVLSLEVKNFNAQGFKTTDSLRRSMNLQPNAALMSGKGFLGSFNQSLFTLDNFLENRFQIPVVDQTGITNHYDFFLQWNERDPKQPNNDALKQVLLSQLGLVLVPTNMPIEMLVVEKAN